MRILLNNKRMSSILLVFAIFLSSFDSFVSGVTVGDLLLVFCIILRVVSGNLSVKKNNAQIFFFFLLLLILSLLSISFSSSLFLGNFIKRIIKFGIYCISVALLSDFIDQKLFFNTMSIFLYICFGGLLLQYILKYLFGITSNIIIIPFLRYSQEYKAWANFSRQFRPSSFFLEPAHLTQFTIPLIIYNLFCKSDKETIKHAIALSLFVLLTTSGTAVFMLLLVWGLYFVPALFKSINSSFKSISVLVVLFLIFFSLYKYVPEIKFAIERLMDTDGVVYSGRLDTGKSIYENFDFSQKLFGLGFGNFSNEIYMNSISFLYCSGGIFAFILCSLLLLFYFSFGNTYVKVLIFSFIALCFASRILTSMYFILFFIPLCSEKFLNKKWKMNKLKIGEC